MYIEDFERILRLLREERVKLDQYINNISIVDSALADVVIENKYTEQLSNLYDKLFQELFGELYEEVSWFLYEWTAGFTVKVSDVTYTINSIEDYIEYIKQEYQLPMKPQGI